LWYCCLHQPLQAIVSRLRMYVPSNDETWRANGKCVVSFTLRKRQGDAYVQSIAFARKTAPLEHRVVITKPETELQDRIDKCVAALDQLNVPLSAGRPSCAGALRERSYGFRHDVIAEAVRKRKLRPPGPADRDSRT
jgi:hypothetical protein